MFDPDAPENVKALLRHWARADFPIFAKMALNALVPQFQDNWHIDALLWHGLQVIDGAMRRSIVNAPPRSLKSIIFSSVMPAFMLGQDPGAKIICLSHGQDLADKLARDTLRLMREPFYAELFPDTRLSKFAAENLETTAGGFRLATSMQGGVTGRGGDMIIVDDPMRAGDSHSETVRPRLNTWFDDTLSSRLNNVKTGRMAVVMQRLHQNDLTGHLLENEDWKSFTLPAIAEHDRYYDLGYGRTHLFQAGQSMHEERLPLYALEAMRRMQGSRTFNSQYLQDPAPADGQTFKRAWLKHGPVVRQPGDKVVQSWDAASKSGDQNDYSVCITAIIRRSEVLILDVFRGRLEFPDLKKKAVELAQLHKPFMLLIEDASAGTQLIQMLKAEQPRGMPLPTAVKAVNNKVDRADIAAARMESGALILPEKAPWLGAFEHELMAFPSSKYDDQVDALSHLMAHTQRSGTVSAIPYFGQGG